MSIWTPLCRADSHCTRQCPAWPAAPAPGPSCPGWAVTCSLSVTLDHFLNSSPSGCSSGLREALSGPRMWASEERLTRCLWHREDRAPAGAWGHTCSSGPVQAAVGTQLSRAWESGFQDLQPYTSFFFLFYNPLNKPFLATAKPGGIPRPRSGPRVPGFCSSQREAPPPTVLGPPALRQNQCGPGELCHQTWSLLLVPVPMSAISPWPPTSTGWRVAPQLSVLQHCIPRGAWQGLGG